MCLACKGEVIAKCGTHRIFHWAHKATRECDSWGEKETEWHRTWKNRFAPESQETVLWDEVSGEKHVADVRTQHGLVIEFQHSHLDPLERIARERFYGNMVWIVDGTRLQRDYPRFFKGRESLQRTNNEGYFLLSFPEECFPALWLESTVPVIFDFRGIADALEPEPFRDVLWCLLPGRAEGRAVVIGMSREDFVRVAPSRAQLLPVQDIISGFSRRIRESRAAEGQMYRQFSALPRRGNPRRNFRF